MSRGLLIVDVQNDFVEGGALGVDGGKEVGRRIASLVNEHGDDYAIVVASRDWHRPDHDNGGHIALTGDPDFVESWPAHGIAGTPGAEYFEALDGIRIDSHIRKGFGEPAYSMFEGHDDEGRTAAEVLRDAGVDEVDVVGIATDHCVRATSLAALGEGLRVNVLTGLVAGVDPAASQRALEELAAAGAHLA